MKKKLFKLTLCLIATSLLISSLSCRRSGEVERQLFEVKKGDIEVTVSADGNFSLVRSCRLTFATSGTITEIEVKEGEQVSEGQILARLDTASLEHNISTAEIAVKSAEIDLELATDNYKKITYPYTYYTFAFGVPEALAAIQLAQTIVESIETLLASDLTPERLSEINRQLQDAKDNLALAREKLGRGQGADLFLSGQLSIASFWTLRDAQLNMEKAKLTLEKTKNELKKAQDELSKTVIKAPFIGLIAQVNAEEGDKLSSVDYPNKVIFELIDPAQLELKVTVDEIDIAKLSLGQKARISLDALPEAAVTGEVTYISPLSGNEGGIIVYEVRITLYASRVPELRAGMTAKAEITTSERTGVLLVPERVIYENDKGNPAAKVLVEGQVEEREVEMGLSDGKQIEIISGLNEGEVVMIERKATHKPQGFLSGGG